LKSHFECIGINLYIPNETISFQDELNKAINLLSRAITNEIGMQFIKFS